MDIHVASLAYNMTLDPECACKLVLLLHFPPVFPPKLGNRGKFKLKNTELKFPSIAIIIDYNINTSPKITKYQGFTYLKKISGGNTAFQVICYLS